MHIAEEIKTKAEIDCCHLFQSLSFREAPEINDSGTEVYTVLDRKTLGNLKKMFITRKASN